MELRGAGIGVPFSEGKCWRESSRWEGGEAGRVMIYSFSLGELRTQCVVFEGEEYVKRGGEERGVCEREKDRRKVGGGYAGCRFMKQNS